MTKPTTVTALELRGLALPIGPAVITLAGRHNVNVAIGPAVVALARRRDRCNRRVAGGQIALETQLRLVLLLQRHGQRLLLDDAILPVAALAQAARHRALLVAPLAARLTTPQAPHLIAHPWRGAPQNRTWRRGGHADCQSVARSRAHYSSSMRRSTTTATYDVGVQGPKAQRPAQSVNRSLDDGTGTHSSAQLCYAMRGSHRECGARACACACARAQAFRRASLHYVQVPGARIEIYKMGVRARMGETETRK